MFGYVNINKPELKIKDYYTYRGFYCGLCHVLQDNYGMLGKYTLSYDITFLVVLLSSLYEPETTRKDARCMVHPIQKQTTCTNEITKYAADMNIVLMYYKLLDDWKDDKNVVALVAMRGLHKDFRKVREEYPQKCAKMKKYLELLNTAEKEKNSNLDQISGYFGKLMAEIFVYKKDIWEKDLRKMAFFLGKFIYIIDAWDDIEEDIKKKKYNPLEDLYKENGDFKKECGTILSLMMSECAVFYEKLPCVKYADILNNIIYTGVWKKFDAPKEKKGKNCNDGSI